MGLGRRHVHNWRTKEMKQTHVKQSKKGEAENAGGGAVVEKKGTALAVAGMFEADAGAGLEGADKDSFAIPFLSILQPLSPIVAEGQIDGAKAGLFINSVTNQMSASVLIVPVAFQRKFLRWQPREKGGGYKGEYSPIDVDTGKVEGMVRTDEGRIYIGGSDPKQHDQLKDTRNHFVLVVREDGSWSPALISMASTQIKKSKRWLSRIQGVQLRNAAGQHFTPPSFSHIYKATSVRESNDSGIWFGWEIDIVGPVQDAELYQAAKAFHAQVAAGKVETAPPHVEGEAGAGEAF